MQTIIESVRAEDVRTFRQVEGRLIELVARDGSVLNTVKGSLFDVITAVRSGVQIRRGRGRPSADLAGRRFGHLTVTGYAGAEGRSMWNCRCDCGKEVQVRCDHLKNQGSCGCRGAKVNNRRNSRWIEMSDGRRMTVAQAARATGLSRRAVEQNFKTAKALENVAV